MTMTRRSTLKTGLRAIALVIVLQGPQLSASTFLTQGEKLFLEDKPREAGALLEQALDEDPANETIYVYLGIIYGQLNDTDKSTRLMKRGLTVAQNLKDVLYFNIGNNYFRLGDYFIAEEMYSSAIRMNREFDAAYLNRANTRLENEDYSGALADYLIYLQLTPATDQRDQIEQVVAALKASMEHEERLRQEELQKQRALMNEVLNSLKNASEDARNVSVGSEEIKAEFEESELED